MALFQRKQPVYQNIQLYTLGQHKTIMIVGLGNVGPQYDGTRHNIGFETVDYFASLSQFGPWSVKSNLLCELTYDTMGDKQVFLIKPTTFMNASGDAVSAVMRYYKIPVEDIVIVHDELDIPFGQIRTRVGGQSAGHNGLESIIKHIGENFGRIRIGIKLAKADETDSAQFVLAKFSKEEQKHINSLNKEVAAILSEYVYGSTTLAAETRSFII
ncbi:MAG TPA: aminoacyl-tRNA hydrolase [Candidatus Saccharimonadales bacterium]|jgi:PTH1 family peptidyl-tRNA hydrolase|nr:aminoacyl-tRNA hydrolase [Candidatus Saccharimonadales bacterium]